MSSAYVQFMYRENSSRANVHPCDTFIRTLNQIRLFRFIYFYFIRLYCYEQNMSSTREVLFSGLLSQMSVVTKLNTLIIFASSTG